MEQPCLSFGWVNRRLTAGGAFEFRAMRPDAHRKVACASGAHGGGWLERLTPHSYFRALMTRQIAGSGT